nr:hypothetical protein [Pasteurella multocida]
MATSEPLNKWGYHVLIALDQLATPYYVGHRTKPFQAVLIGGGASQTA